MSVRVFIDGGSGTTGLEIANRLAHRSEITLVEIDAEARKSAEARRAAMQEADFAILCLPDDAAREAVALAEGLPVRFIDASTAHRTAPGWVFGFAELIAGQREAIANAARVSNPGCYSTGFIAMIAPLVQRGLLPADLFLTCNAVSGYSGGGKSMITRFEEEETDIAWRGYALSLNHKHVPEMQQRCGLTHPPLFAPSVIPAYRGMTVEVPVIRAMDARIAPVDALRAALSEHYAGSPVVHFGGLGGDGELLLRQGSAPTDALTIDVFASADGEQMRFVAMLDNLGKGASGACVQNLNIMAGLSETAGLRI